MIRTHAWGRGGARVSEAQARAQTARCIACCILLRPRSGRQGEHGKLMHMQRPTCAVFHLHGGVDVHRLRWGGGGRGLVGLDIGLLRSLLGFDLRNWLLLLSVRHGCD